MVLSNDEINAAYIEAANQTLRPQDERIALAFARAIIAATIDKLSSTSVEGIAYLGPDKDMLSWTRICDACTPVYPQEAIAAARVQALEEAAKECDRTASDYKGMFAEDESLYIAATDCAKEIRALIGANHGRV